MTKVSALTIEEVGCLSTSKAVTRREVHGKNIEAKTPSAEHPEPTSSEVSPAAPQRGDSFLADILFPMSLPGKHFRTAQELKVARQLKAKRQALPTGLSPGASVLIGQLETAQYALALCNSRFNLTEICQDLRDPAAIEPLASVGIDAPQASNIVCWASLYGIDLNTTNAALLGDFAAAIYALELGDNFTTTTNTTNLCNKIDLAAAPFLGIDAGAINNFICGGPSTSVTVTAVTTQTVIVVPGSPTVTITASGAGVSGGFPWASGVGTGAPNGLPNGTFPSQTAGGSAVSGGVASGGPAATGAGNPWSNSTGTDSLGIGFPPASGGSQGENLKTPLGPDSPQYYPASTLLTTTTTTWGGYA